MALAVFILGLFTASMQAATLADSAVFGVFKQADKELAHFALLRRTSVTEELDLVIAIGSHQALSIEPTRWAWIENDKVGLFLQEKTRPERVYSLGMKSGVQDCTARMERVTATDSVISCWYEKSGRAPTEKWVYDVRAKRLLQQFSYRPFAIYRIFPSGDGAVFVGSDTQRLVAVGFKPGRDPEFRILNAAESAEWFRKVPVSEGTAGLDRVLNLEPEVFRPRRFGPAGSFRLLRREGAAPHFAIEEQSGNRIRSYPLPQSTYDEFAAARPSKVRDGYVREQTSIEEQIGPWQLEQEKLWFGKAFYDSEGRNGVGGFGYFSSEDRKYHLFTPPEMAGWSVSAMEVEPDAVWMALAANGEYGESSGGLLRYDRQSGALRRLELPDIGVGFVRVGGKLLAATDFGLVVVEGNLVKRYFVDRTRDGRLRVAAENH